MKKMILVLVFSLAVVSLFGANFTPSTTIISNVSTAGCDVFGTISVTNRANAVVAIYGGTWTGESDTSGAVASGTMTNTTYLTNLGNVATTFDLTVPWTNYTGTSGAAWTWQFDNVTDVASDVSDITINACAVKTIDFIVTVDAGAQNGSTGDFRPRAQVNGNTTSTNYTGDNTLNYGGEIGDASALGAGYGAGYILIDPTDASSQREWLVTVAGPVLTIAKTIEEVTSAAWGTGAALTYPGATITYKIRVVNTGSGAAANVYINDVVPEWTTIKGVADARLEIKVSGDESASVWGDGAATTDAAGDDQGYLAGTAAGSAMTFAPGGTANAGTGTGALTATGGASDEAACWFQVTIN